MSLQIMKLAIAAATTATTTGAATLTIDAADFFGDTGGAANALPALATDNSYYNVYYKWLAFPHIRQELRVSVL